MRDISKEKPTKGRIHRKKPQEEMSVRLKVVNQKMESTSVKVNLAIDTGVNHKLLLEEATL